MTPAQLSLFDTDETENRKGQPAFDSEASRGTISALLLMQDEEHESEQLRIANSMGLNKVPPKVEHWTEKL